MTSTARVVAVVAGQGERDVNQTATRFAVHGTDLGIMWRDSRGRLALVFGDTYGVGWGGHGAGPETADWRCNTLAFATDDLRIESMVTDRPGHAAQILARDPTVEENTVIPTAGFAWGGRDYLHYMSVRSWGTGGRWTTNYAGLAHSDDGGRMWVKQPRWPASAGFQMGAFARHDGHGYLFGTPSGRLGDACVARVDRLDVRRHTSNLEFEYWAGDRWGPSGAVPVMAGPVGELSVQYNDVMGQWVAVHLDEHRAAIVLRTAPEPTGPWTAGRVIADGAEFPGLYGGFLHPDNGSAPRFTMSRWDPYHVLLMELDNPASSG